MTRGHSEKPDTQDHLLSEFVDAKCPPQANPQRGRQTGGSKSEGRMARACLMDTGFRVESSRRSRTVVVMLAHLMRVLGALEPYANFRMVHILSQ